MVALGTLRGLSVMTNLLDTQLGSRAAVPTPHHRLSSGLQLT